MSGVSELTWCMYNCILSTLQRDSCPVSKSKAYGHLQDVRNLRWFGESNPSIKVLVLGQLYYNGFTMVSAILGVSFLSPCRRKTPSLQGTPRPRCFRSILVQAHPDDREIATSLARVSQKVCFNFLGSWIKQSLFVSRIPVVRLNYDTMFANLFSQT